jgi:putative flippase GtrA
LFNLIGSGGFVLQVATIALLTRAGGWHYGVATIVAVELAILHNFVWHCRYTWADRPATPRDRLRQLPRYQLAKTLSLFANVAITAWLVTTTGLAVELASLAAVLSLSVVNFLVSDRLVFAARPWGPMQSSPAAASSARMSASQTELSPR